MSRLLARSVALLAVVPAAVAGDPSSAIRIPEWKVVGPFETGSREGLVHHLARPDGSVPKSFTFEETYPSVLADGGRVGWKTVAAERDGGKLTGKTQLELEGVGWEAREDEWGGAGVLNTAYASATFTLAGPTNLLVDASRCVVVIDGVAIAGDPYGEGIAQSVVHGSTGRHDLLVVTSGFGPERAFTLTLTPLPSDELARLGESDVLLPDILAGEGGRGVAGVPIVSATEQWLDDVTVEVSGALAGSRSIGVPLAPFATLKVAVPVTWTAVPLPEKDTPVPVLVTVKRAGRVLASANVKASVHDRKAAHVETFVSTIDGSAQQFAVLPPSAGGDAVARKALVLSLHGAGVQCLGQARSYSQKDWAYVVAPTNRRAYGFDWHDWGALDAEEVLATAMERFPIDAERVHLSGHSMGGHGTWAFGTTHPGLFASVAPSAGWNGYDSYLPITLRRSVNFASEDLSAMYFRAIAPGRAGTNLANLTGLPVFVLQGGADDNVPPTHARLLTGELQRMGADVTYREVADKGHWWDVDKERPGADCVDSADLEAFWKAHVRPQGASRVVLESIDPDVTAARDWVELLEQRRVAERSRIEATVAGTEAAAGRGDAKVTRVAVATRNVARFAVDLGDGRVAGRQAVLEVDGQDVPVDLQPEQKRVVLSRGSDDAWRAGGSARSAAQRPPVDGLRPGSFKKAMYEPFVIVVGTQAGLARTERMLELARSLALAWWVRANGTSPIVRDTDVTPEMRVTRNLVLLGGPEVNAESARMAGDLLLVARGGGARLAGHGVAGGADLACVHWQPSPDAPSRRVLVFQATTPDADTLLGSFNPVGSGQGWPDFIVATPAVRLRSWAGFAAAGWWDPRFAYDPSNTWLTSNLRP